MVALVFVDPTEDGEKGRTSDGVDIGTADTASLDLDIDITVLELFRLDL